MVDFANKVDSDEAAQSKSSHLVLNYDPSTELQVRGGYMENNSKIIFLISQQKHML